MRWRCSACQTENLGRHKVCLNCTKPKDNERFYDAPETASPTANDAVTDAHLVALATAGADWECRYCGSHQPRARHECSNCGAPAKEAAKPITKGRQAPAPADQTARSAAVKAPPARRRSRRGLIALGAVVLIVAALFWLFRPKVVEARVVQRAWEHVVVVERYQIVPGEGFAEKRPPGAFDVVSVGKRHHHDERVQDGTERESYTEQVACGEDCSTTSVTCTENDNGFKTCSGGDRVCTTRYCSETRYRDVPRYKNVPVYETWYKWRAWQWQEHRSVVEKGNEDTPRWPSDARVALEVGCGPGEKERARRAAKYEIFFEDGEHQRYPYRARHLEEFSSNPPGTTRKIRVGRGRDPEIVHDE